MVELRKEACNVSPSASAAKEKEEKGEKEGARSGAKEEKREREEELAYWWGQLRLLKEREEEEEPYWARNRRLLEENGPLGLDPMTPEEREIYRQIALVVMRSPGRKQDSGTKWRGG